MGSSGGRVLLIIAVQWLGWYRVQAQQPTPPPTLFAGSSYNFDQCAEDVAQADTNGDGFISRDEEYSGLINRIGAAFCYEQTSGVTADQSEAYFRLVCELVPNCLITSEIPVEGLTSTQIIKICTETWSKLFNRCPEPTASPGEPNVPPSPPVPPPSGTPRPRPPFTAPPIPSPVPPSPTPGQPSPTPPGTTAEPTVTFDPVAPDVSLAQCRQDLTAADANSNERITRQEFVSFLKTFGDRVCYERDATDTTLSQAESDTFGALVCLTTEDCEGVTDIDIADETFEPTIAFTLCTVTHQSAMNTSVCDESTGSEETTVSPTETPDDPSTSSPTGAPVTARSGDEDNRTWPSWSMVIVVGTATMLACVWM